MRHPGDQRTEEKMATLLSWFMGSRLNSAGCPLKNHVQPAQPARDGLSTTLPKKRTRHSPPISTNCSAWTVSHGTPTPYTLLLHIDVVARLFLKEKTLRWKDKNSHVQASKDAVCTGTLFTRTQAEQADQRDLRTKRTRLSSMLSDLSTLHTHLSRFSLWGKAPLTTAD